MKIFNIFKKKEQKFFYLRFLIFLLPLYFIYLAFVYQDPFFYLLALVAFGFSIFFISPNFLAKKKFKLPQLEKKKNLIPKITQSISEKLPSVLKTKKKHHQWRFLILLTVSLIFFVLLTTLFTYLTIFQLPQVDTAGDIFKSYYLANLSFWHQKWFFLIIPIIVFVIFDSWLIKKLSRWSFNIQHLLMALTHSLVLNSFALSIAFHLALFLSLSFQFFELRELVLKIKNLPEQVGIYTGQEKVSAELAEMEKGPRLSQANDQLDQEIVYANFRQNQQRGRFYAESLINYLPKNYWPKIQIPEDNLILFADYLLIREIKEEEIQAISPHLARLYIKQHFDPRNIKDEPKEFDVISRQAYLEFRDDFINDQLAEIDGQIAVINQKIANAQAGMRDAVYKYIYGELSIDEAIRQYDSHQARINQLQQERADLQQLRDLVETSKEIAPYELGIFIPDKDNMIKVVLDKTDQEALNIYFATLIHEYLHYSTYIDQERLLPLFFEEGLTEYFARQVMKDELKLESSAGYPLIVEIIKEMTKKVPIDKLEEAYFTKDEKILESILDEAYGKDFYSDSQYHFIMIFFSYPKDALRLANDLMNEIGGEQISWEDIGLTEEEMEPE